MGWQGHLREVYVSFGEFESYSVMRNLHVRLGFETPLAAWHANPEVQGSVIPSDYRRVLKRYPRSVVIAHARRMNTPANARKMAWVDSGHYTVSKP